MLFRQIRFFLILLSKNFDSFKPRHNFGKEHKPSRLKLMSDNFLGSCYHSFVSFKEKIRVWVYGSEKEAAKHSILIEFFKHVKRIVFYLIFIFVITSLLDWCFLKYIIPLLGKYDYISNTFSLPSREFISVGLEIFVGGISAILGLIFALFTVGFQLYTDRYSEKVSDFINDETVSDYFFSFLIFTDTFSILTLLKLYYVKNLPFISFTFSAIFVAISVLGILVFKRHYMNSLKPVNLLNSIWSLIKEHISTVSNQCSYKYRSWSLVIYARNSVARYIEVIADMYRDLARSGNRNEASLVPLFLGNIMRDYLDLKKFIDKERGWWSFQRFERVKASDLTMFTIKANYELEGKGGLFIPKSDQDWFEDKVFNILEEITKDSVHDESGKTINSVLDAYKLILVGDYKKQVDTAPKVVPGSIQNQEFQTFDKAFGKFSDIYKLIDLNNDSSVTSLINNCFQIADGLLQPWDIEYFKKVISSFYHKGNYLNTSRNFQSDRLLPNWVREVLIDYWNRLEVEQVLEGKIVTPLNRFNKEIIDSITSKKNDVIYDRLKKLFKHTTDIAIDLIRKKKYESAGQFIKMQYEWMSRLLFLDEFNIADRFAADLRKNITLLTYVPMEIAIDLELLEQMEKGFFMSLYKRQKSVYKIYANALSLVMIITRNSTGNADPDEVIKMARLPVLWGGIAYVVSESEQDFSYVIAINNAIESIYMGDSFPKLIDAVIEIKTTRNIWWETTRYHSWYSNVLGKIDHDLKTDIAREDGEYGFDEVYVHPSKFIQNLKRFELMDEEKCIEGYGLWVKKRELIKKLLYILNKRAADE
ncbi:MAG: hypothetical protein BWY19_00290 [bacterium ADurb.Bin212]|nr:MAG: hypothetical protein BWY19_00290 [bacterium ADurb.Bin212]